MARETNAALIKRLRETANLETFNGGLPGNDHAGANDGPAIREATRLYRNTWMNPILDEIERRFVKVKPNAR